MLARIKPEILALLLATATIAVASADDSFPASLRLQSQAQHEASPAALYQMAGQSLEFQEPGCGEPSGELPNRTEFATSGAESDLFQNLSLFGGIDGSKQPQDYGVNANLGIQGNVNIGFPLDQLSGLGLQIGTGIVASQNAVRVYELLGEATSRTQSYTTIGLFQRTGQGFIWAFAHDFLAENSYDKFFLSQFRARIGFDADDLNQFGITAQLRGLKDSGTFSGTPVSLRSINQSSLYWRHIWESAAQSTIWVGLADSHGENNAVTGPSRRQRTIPVFGADFLAPLNDHFAMYGETNLIMPADTGTVDAFLGFQWFPGGGAKRARRTRFAPVFSVASPTTFSVDLR